MNNIIKSGEVMKLKDLISYEEGSISNLDVVSNDTMKFVLMAFDEEPDSSAPRSWQCHYFCIGRKSDHRIRRKRLQTFRRRKFPF